MVAELLGIMYNTCKTCVESTNARVSATFGHLTKRDFFIH